jgi:opacity protein-like surface antigen
MKKPVAALLAVLACACVASPAAADEMSDLYAKVMADPGNTQLNLEYAALAEKNGKPRLALAAYERILLNDPGNADAQVGVKRVTRMLLGDSTRWIASIGGGWDSNPAQIPNNPKSSAIALGSVAVHDERYWGSTPWQTDGLAVAELVSDEDELTYGFLGAETGPVFDTGSWFTIHPAVGAGWSYFDNTSFYSEAVGSVTLEGIQGGANQIARVKVGYRTYDDKFTTDNGWYVHVNGRWGVPHIFGDKDVLIFSPWFRWSDINGMVPVSLDVEAEPGRYTEFGADLAYFVPLAENVVLGANITVSDRNYRDPGLLSGHDDRHDTMWTPGLTLIFKHVFAFQSDVRIQYRHRDNESNDETRSFNENVLTVNLDKRF